MFSFLKPKDKKDTECKNIYTDGSKQENYKWVCKKEFDSLKELFQKINNNEFINIIYIPKYLQAFDYFFNIKLKENISDEKETQNLIKYKNIISFLKNFILNDYSIKYEVNQYDSNLIRAKKLLYTFVKKLYLQIEVVLEFITNQALDNNMFEQQIIIFKNFSDKIEVYNGLKDIEESCNIINNAIVRLKLKLQSKNIDTDLCNKLYDIDYETIYDINNKYNNLKSNVPVADNILKEHQQTMLGVKERQKEQLSQDISKKEELNFEDLDFIPPPPPPPPPPSFPPISSEVQIPVPISTSSIELEKKDKEEFELKSQTYQPQNIEKEIDTIHQENIMKLLYDINTKLDESLQILSKCLTC